MTLWFSATAVTPSLVHEFHLSTGQAAWLTMAVQGGFVAGTLVSALLNLPDVLQRARLFAVGCLLGSIATAAITRARLAHGGHPAALRDRRGAGLRLSHRPQDRGRVVPRAARDRARRARRRADGRPGVPAPARGAARAPTAGAAQLLATSGLAVVGAVVVLTAVRDGPFAVPAERFDPRAAARVYRDRPTRLAIFGYLGHQWELYAMWTWMAAFAAASLAARGAAACGPHRLRHGVRRRRRGRHRLPAGRPGRRSPRQGARGRHGADRVADPARCSRALVFGAHPALLYAFVAVWGTAVVADSAQFSALVADNSRPEYVGTALTVETCSGYLLTMLTIRMIPSLAAARRLAVGVPRAGAGPDLRRVGDAAARAET